MPETGAMSSGSSDHGGAGEKEWVLTGGHVGQEHSVGTVT